MLTGGRCGSGTTFSATTYSLSNTFTSLVPDTTYYSRVKAINHSGIETAYTDLGSTMTLKSPTPTGLVYTSATTTSLTARSFRAQEKLFAEGDAGDALYFLLSGKVAIQKILDPAQGTFKTLTVIAPGDFFGEMALLEKEPRSASAVALTDGEALAFSAEEFNRWFSQDARLPVRLFLPFVSTLSARLRDTTREMTTFLEVGRVLVQDQDVRQFVHLFH
jgi:hypothetical protein